MSVSATYSKLFEASSASPAGELNWPSPVPDLPNFSTKQTPSATLSVPEGHVFFSTSSKITTWSLSESETYRIFPALSISKCEGFLKASFPSNESKSKRNLPE